jgi:uncharacterized YccA/Bax inhibitor family protein
MESKNPVFARLDQQASGEAGFAYAEGVSAYTQAGGAPHTAPYGTPQQPPRAGQAPYPAPPPIPPQAPYGQTPYGQNPYAQPTSQTGIPTGSVLEPVTDRMSLDDVLVKTALCFAVLLPGAVIGWVTAPTMPWLYIVAMFAGLVMGLMGAMRANVSPPLILGYAFAEGIFLGGISWWYNEWVAGTGYENLVSQAVIGTLVAFGVMLALYKSRLVKVDGRFQRIMLVMMVSYLVIGLASFISALFGVGNGWGFYGMGTLGIILCLIGVALASFSLLLDFESISRGIQMGLPERESWRMAFGLLVTLVWLYLEILRLLAIVASSRD